MSTVTLPTTTTTNTPAPSVTTQASQARTQLSGNFDTFLKLLTAQLQNQDPLNPTDSTQFTQQLVQYSQVEQQIETNSQLTSLSSSLTKQIQATSAGAALAYIGHTATFSSDAMGVGDSGGAAWNYDLGANAASVQLVVTDDAGNAVYQANGEQGKGDHTFTWNGKATGGAQAPPGTYHLKVKAVDTSGEDVTAAISVTEKITGVDLSSSDGLVTTPSGSRSFTGITKVTG